MSDVGLVDGSQRNYDGVMTPMELEKRLASPVFRLRFETFALVSWMSTSLRPQTPLTLCGQSTKITDRIAASLNPHPSHASQSSTAFFDAEKDGFDILQHELGLPAW